MKNTIFSALFFLLVSQLQAQTGTFSHDNSAYADRAAGRAIAPDSLWDDPTAEWDSATVTHRLNFPFYAEGYNLDTFLIGDGYINSVDETFGIGNFSDLVDKGLGRQNGPKSKITISRIGTAPNRVVVIQWANHGFYGDFDLRGQCTDSGHMQLWIYETGKKIELRFGNSYFMDFASTMADFTLLGYYVTDGISFNGISLEGNPNSPSLGTDITNSIGLTAYPSSGKRYTFTFDGSAGAKAVGKAGNNPWYAAGSLYFRQESSVNYTLTDAAGRLVKTGTASNGERIAHGLKPGVYALQVLGKSGRTNLKIVVE
ncbi:MAG: T9SS type A sorting domain-containing protein [Sphingomonadales bacterium]|jgi:hypothetical protein